MNKRKVGKRYLFIPSDGKPHLELQATSDEPKREVWEKADQLFPQGGKMFTWNNRNSGIVPVERPGTSEKNHAPEAS